MLSEFTPMLSELEKFAVLMRWLDSHRKGSIGRIAKELRLPKEHVQTFIMEIEAKEAERPSSDGKGKE